MYFRRPRTPDSWFCQESPRQPRADEPPRARPPPERGPQTSHRRDVLDADRQSRQRPDLVTARDPSIDRRGVVERPRIERDDGVERGVEAIATRETRRDVIARGDVFRGDQPP